MSTENKERSLEELRKRTQKIKPLPEEPEFLGTEETLLRYLKAYDWDVDEAEKRLNATIEYRRSTRPLEANCQWCLKRPGFHSMRQIGFDESGRPVLYSCFAQAATHKNKVEDAVQHVTYLIENAKMSMKPGISTWVFVIDCTGLSIPACNPKLGYGVTQIMASHYPERLGMVICVNHNPVFQGIWRAIKVFLHPTTVSKMKLIRSKEKVLQTFHKYFPDELTDWLVEEIRLNKQHPLSELQRNFWAMPKDSSTHDPRGCAAYVKQYVDSFKTDFHPKTEYHKPHPNIMYALEGDVKEVPLTAEELSDREAAQSMAGMSSANATIDSDVEENDIPEIDIDEKFKIPSDAKPLHS